MQTAAETSGWKGERETTAQGEAQATTTQTNKNKKSVQGATEAVYVA